LATQSGTFSGTSSGTNTGDNAPNSSSTYIGTTAVALNRSSGPLTLGGITLTTPDLGTPTAVVLTNATGTATGLTAGLATSLSGGVGGSIPYQSAAGTTAMLANGNAGQFLKSNGTTSAPSWGDAEVPLTFSSGLTRTTNTITNNLITGLAGGQTVIGGTAITDALSLKGTTGNGTLTAAAINVLVGNNGGTTAGFVRNDGKWILGATAPTNLGLLNVSAPNNMVGLTVNGANSTSGDDLFQFWRANVQKYFYADQYGGIKLGQTNSTGQLSVDSNGNFGQIISFNNSNTGVGSGSIVTIGSSGTAFSGLRISGGGVNFTQGVNVPQKSTGTIFGLAGDTSVGNVNTLFSIHTQGAGNAYESSQYSRPNAHFGFGHITSADGLLVAGGNLTVINPNNFGGGLGTEVLTGGTPPTSTNWTVSGDFSLSSGTDATYTYSTGVGTLTQAAAKLTGLKANTYYALTYTITNTSGSSYFQISDPSGVFFTPLSIQHSQTAAVKFGGANYGTISNGTHTYFFKTAPTAASISGLPLALRAVGAAAGATFKITSISLKEAQGGDVVLGGLLRGQGSDNSANGVKVDNYGKIKLNASENDTANAWLQLPAGTTAASTAPLKFTSGVSMTTPEPGAIEFTTDDFFATITTGAARKAFILDDGVRLTPGKIPIATTNGRLIDAVGTLPQSGSFSGAASNTTTFTVTIGTTMANTTYKVSATPTTSITAAPFYITNKTTTTFDVVYLAGITGTATFDWSVFP
jgi:hypothetical protein